MPRPMSNAQLEQRLKESLAKDRAKPSRCTREDDGTVTVNISGTSSGLLLALSLATGEPEDVIRARMSEIAPPPIKPGPTVTQWGIVTPEGRVWVLDGEDEARTVGGIDPPSQVVCRTVGPWLPSSFEVAGARKAASRG